jgi:hopanoid biosynthesis associated RND transporter like protein HpnN
LVVEKLRSALLGAAVAASTRRPIWVVLFAFATALAAVAYTVAELEVRADRNQLIRRGRDWNERFEAYRANFAGTKDFVVVLQGGEREEREAYADALAAQLVDDRQVQAVFHRIDPDVFAGRRLMLSEVDRLHELADTLEEERDRLRDLLERPGLESVLRWLDRRISGALVRTVVSGFLGDDGDAEAGEDASSEPLDLGFVLVLLEGMQARLEGADAAYRSPWAELASEGGGGYVTTDEGRLHLVIVTPRRGDDYRGDGRTVDALYAEFAELQDRFPQVQAGVTGQRAISVAEMRASVRDTRKAGILALVGVSLVFVIGFGRVANPILAVIALLVGIAWSAGATTLLVGHLTVLSVAFTSFLIGLGIDFGIHIVARYEEARARGWTGAEAVEAAIRGSGPGNLAGAATTSLAFFGVGFSDFLGLSELGIIAGTGVLLCLLAALFVLPALLFLFPAAARGRPAFSAAPAADTIDRHPRRWVLFGGVLAAVGLLLAPAARFDGNLLRLQAEGVEAVDLELQLIGAQGRGSVFAASVASDLEEVALLSAEFEAQPEVAEVESIARLVPADPASRREAAARIGAILDAIGLERETPEPVDPKRIARRIDKLRFKLRPEREADWDPTTRPRDEELRQARSRLDAVRSALEATEPGAARDALEPYQARVVDDLQTKLETLRREADPLPMTVADVPEPIRRRLVGADGRYLLQIHPSEDIWEPAARSRFVAALRAVDPEVTGIPVQNHEASSLMLRGYLQGGLYSSIVVLLVLLVDLRRLSSVALALIPVVGGWAWTLGIMVVTGLDFDLANLIIIPLMIGIGIDIGIHCVHRFLDDGSAGADLVRGSTGRAVVLSGLTTAIGFGSLAVAQHRGIQNLGLLLAIGVMANVLAALVILAPGLRLLRRSS